MDLCPYGSEPTSTAPTFFQWDGTELTSLFPPLAGFLSLELLGLSTAPQDTAAFCAIGPPTDLAQPEDWLLLGTGAIGILAGAFTRVGNTIKASKWAEICQCKTTPVFDPAFDTPTDYVPYYWHESFNSGTVEYGTFFVSDAIPAGVDHVAVRLVSNDNGAQGKFAVVSPMLVPVGTDLYSNVGFTDNEPAGSPDPNLHGWEFIYAIKSPGPPTYVILNNARSGLADIGNCVVDIAVHYATIPTPTAPTPPAAPTGYPTSGGPCDAPTLSDLCRSLSTVNDKLDYLINASHPPTLVPTAPITPTPDPTVTTPPGAPPKLLPVLKPATAVGIVVHLTVVPETAARYGQSPVFWPDLAHVAFNTASGPLPSVLVKHNPMVLLGIDPMVKGVLLDLEAGVSGTVSWLMPPAAPAAPPP